jgi:hypothetical protein
VSSPAVSRWKPALWIGGAAIVLPAVAAYFAPNALHDRREARRVERDPHAEGTVTDLRDTGEDNHGEPLVEVFVTFHTREGGAVDTHTIERLGVRDVVWLTSHKDVDVWYDPQNPFDAVIRWRSRMR